MVNNNNNSPLQVDTKQGSNVYMPTTVRSKTIFTQDEVDALLKGVNGELTDIFSLQPIRSKSFYLTDKEMDELYGSKSTITE